MHSFKNKTKQKKSNPQELLNEKYTFYDFSNGVKLVLFHFTGI